MASETKLARITCPRCGAQGNAPIWDEIDAQHARRDARHVINETLFEVKCEQCRKKISLNYPLVYHDGERRFVVQYVTSPDQVHDAESSLEETARRMVGQAARSAALEAKKPAEEADAALAAAQADPNALDGYTLRIVTSRDELREKIVILRNGLDDRAIEVLKLTTFNAAAAQGSLKGAKTPRFGGVAKAGGVLIEFTGGLRHRETKVSDDLYAHVADDVAQRHPDRNADLRVGRPWAESFVEGAIS